MAADNILQYIGEYVPSTEIWQVISELSSTDPKSDQFKELIVRLALIVNRINLAVNTKETGIYNNLQEFVTSSQYFFNPALTSASSQTPSYRAVYRTVINFGALPAAAGTKSVPHHITCLSSTSFVKIYAVATDPVGLNYIPIPYASSVLANNIELSVDSTNVNITVGVNRSAFTICYVVLEYLQQ